MEFKLLSEHPDKFCPCLIRRDLEKALEINGVVHYGMKERRSEYVLGYYSGMHWLGRESHWCAWAEIPSESSKEWQSAKLFVPESLKPVLAILPQLVVMGSFTIPAGLHFALFDDRSGDRTWKIYQRLEGSRLIKGDELLANRCWFDVGMKKISSWLELPDINLDEKLRKNA